jgi:hypothetical protein
MSVKIDIRGQFPESRRGSLSTHRERSLPLRGSEQMDFDDPAPDLPNSCVEWMPVEQVFPETNALSGVEI